MSNNAEASHGTVIQIGDGGGPENFTNIAEVKDIAGPGFDRNMHDAYCQTDTWISFVAGALNIGEISFPLNHIPTDATHDVTTGLMKDLIDGTLRNFKMVFSDGSSTEWLFPCYVKGFTPSNPNYGIREATVTLQPSGTPTLA